MAITLVKAYQGFAVGAGITFPAELETALVAQGMAVYDSVGSVNPAVVDPITGFVTSNTYGYSGPLTGAITAGTYGPRVINNIQLGSSVLTGYETDGVAQTAWVANISDIWVPYWGTWTGAGVLAGTTVATTFVAMHLFNTAGFLLATTLITGGTVGTVMPTASVFAKQAFTTPITLSPGRYFIGVQVDATGADTIRHVLVANGAEPRCRATAALGASFVASLAALRAAPIAVPTTFTTALAPIVQLYS